MDTVSNDPELASEMLALMNKELKAARLRIKELEARNGSDEANVATYIGRAEATEQTLEALKANLLDMSSENRLLRTALEELKDSKRVVKSEILDKDQQAEAFKVTRDQSISATGQSNPDTGGHIKELESALERYHSKYKTATSEKKELKMTYQGLEEEVSRLRAENKELERQVTNERVVAASSADVIDQRTSSTLPMILSRGDVDDYMQRFPKVDGRPRSNALRSVHHNGVDLKKYLAADKRMSSCSVNFLFLPGLLEWCREAQHAFAIGPIHMFDPATRRWIRKSIFDALYDKTFSLFYKWGPAVYYAGTYKAIKLAELCPNGFEGGRGFSKGVSLSSLADATVFGDNSARNDDRKPPPESAIRQLYQDGVLKVEPLGLQCIEFDHELYAALKDRREKNPPNSLLEVAYYPENTEHERPKKKQKTG